MHLFGSLNTTTTGDVQIFVKGIAEIDLTTWLDCTLSLTCFTRLIFLYFMLHCETMALSSNDTIAIGTVTKQKVKEIDCDLV